MFNILIDYPSSDEEVEIVKSNTGESLNTVSPQISNEDLLQFQELVRQVPIADNVVQYAVDFVSSTRPQSSNAPEITKNFLEWGAGPRASTFLILAAKAHCLVSGNPTPEINDVKAMIKPILRHRIILNFTAEAEGVSKEKILDELI